MFSVTGLMSRVSNTINTFLGITDQIRQYLTQMPVLLDNIQLEIVSEPNESYTSDVPSINVEDGSKISDNISNNALVITMKVQIMASNHKQLFERLLTIRDQRRLVDLYMVKLYKNMAITSIEKPTYSMYYTEFNMTLQQVEVVYLDTIPAPSPKAKPATQKRTQVNTRASSSNGGSDYEGELQSDSIVLPEVNS